MFRNFYLKLLTPTKNFLALILTVHENVVTSYQLFVLVTFRETK